MDMKFVRGRRERMVSVGWQDNVLQVEWKGGKRYTFGGVPESVKDKLLSSPYPDSLFSKIVRGKYVSDQVAGQDPNPKPVPPPTFDFDDLPF